MNIESFMRPPTGVVSCEECGRRRPEHAPACSRFAAGAKPDAATSASTPSSPAPSGDYLPLPEMLTRLAEAKDQRDAVGARIAKPGIADPELAAEWDEALVGEWRIVDEIVSALRAGEPGYPPPFGPPEATGRWCPVQQMMCWDADCSNGCEITQPEPAP